ncbi:hypothetical protein BX600DRAFT_37944 [Xylariales sp. PMI_506]|nr:hypothetical protein BX600DRAFT_37944 [Xylariales sp. PMI_506]
MAPLSTDPRQLLVVLNVARRKALYTLVTEIFAYMRSQLELAQSSPDGSPSAYPARGSRSGHSVSDDARRPSGPANSGDDDKFPGPVPVPVPAPQPSLALSRLRKAALVHFDSWRAEVLGKLREILSSPDDQNVLDARRKRAELLAKDKAEVPREGEDLLSFGSTSAVAAASSARGGDDRTSKAAVAMQHLYHPIPTRLTTIAMEDRKEALSSVLLLLLSMGNYSAYSRTLVCYLASALEVPPMFLDAEEVQIATTMVKSAQEAEKQKKKRGMSAEEEAQKRKEQGQVSRFWKVGLASVAGAAVIGVTGGLAAPLVAGAIGGLMGSVGLGGLASFLGIFWMNGALVGTIFGAMGAQMTGSMIDQYAKEVEDFRFLPLKEEWGSECKKEDAEVRRLRVTIGINGWLTEEGDVTKHWRSLGDESEVFALRYEMKSLLELGVSLQGLISSYAWAAIQAEILKRTVLATLWSALWPAHLLYIASSIDNPFTLARNRSEKAGKILADALINKVQGERPVTLVGYSLGARVIYSCLKELAERRAFGLVDTVVLIGAPVPSNPGYWQMMRTVVSGKLFNVYSENDYILAFLYRTTSIQLGIAGLQPIPDEIEGVENFDLSAEVSGHLRYPGLIAKILTRCGFPNVKGGEGEIEKDDEQIQLRNADYAEMGSLIDLDETPKKSAPNNHSFEDQANEKFDPSVKGMLEQKTDLSVKDAKFISDKNAGKSGAKMPSAAVATRSLPEASNPPKSCNKGRVTQVDAEPAAREYTSFDGPPPSYSQKLEVHDDRQRGSVMEDDEEEYGGIQMQDNDADMITIEPLSIDDESYPLYR